MFDTNEAEQVVQEALDKSLRLLQNNRGTEAEIILTQTLKVDEENAKALQLLGLVYYQSSQNEKAIEAFSKAIELEPDNSENHNNIALCYSRTGELEKAFASVKKAIELKPNRHYYHDNLALIHRQAGDYESAFETFEKALEIKNDPRIWRNMGITFTWQKRLDETIRCFKKAIELEHDNANSHIDLACAYFLDGRLKEGWKEYEHRFNHPSLKPLFKYFGQFYEEEKRWDGKQSIDGKRLVVYCEQGVGDMIQFVRFLSDLKKLGCKILLHSHRDLLPLLKENQLGQDETNSQFEDYDYHCSVMSLPYLLGIEKITREPYITCAQKIDFTQYYGLKKIGIIWGGNPQHPNDFARSCPLSYFRAIHDLPGVKLFSLQKDIRKRAYGHTPEGIDLTKDCEDMKIVGMAKHLENFEETAAVLKELDLLVTIDTATLHLAGAMGRPVFALIPHTPDWRWQIEGGTSDWYPSVRLFRQTSPRNWESVFEQIVPEVKNVLSI